MSKDPVCTNPIFKDLMGTVCIKCEQGVYEETSIHDDIDGVLHCSYCSHLMPRYLPVGEDHK